MYFLILYLYFYILYICILYIFIQDLFKETFDSFFILKALSLSKQQESPGKEVDIYGSIFSFLATPAPSDDNATVINQSNSNADNISDEKELDVNIDNTEDTATHDESVIIDVNKKNVTNDIDDDELLDYVNTLTPPKLNSPNDPEEILTEGT